MTAVELELHDLAHGGDAVGLHEGKAVFVPFGIPGETVRVQLVEAHKRFARGRLLKVLEPAPERVSPRCRYFGLCGGCHWQHIEYEAQLGVKRQILLAQLERVGKQSGPVVRPTLGMSDPWVYRNHVQLAIDAMGGLGYYATRSHDVVPVEKCPIVHPLLDALWDGLDVECEGLRRISLRAGTGTGEQMVIFEGEGDPPELEVDVPVSCLYSEGGEELVILAGNSYFHERVSDRILRVSGPSFFQVNTLQAERMIEVVGSYLDLKSGETLLDAYCGVGTLALSLMPPAARAIGIDGSPWAIADALANNSGDEVEFVLGSVEEVMPSLGTSCDALVLDPPRSGCSPEALRALACAGASRIVYVSCDPATLARDILRLTSTGYDLIEVQPIDMFPQTYHIESCALLHRT